MNSRTLLDDVVDRALAEVRQRGLQVYTVALYHDHESDAVSVCVDTALNSRRVVDGINSYNLPHFLQAVAYGDLEHAALWQANIGRSLSLGDFTAVNLARTDLSGVRADEGFYLSMVQALVARHDDIHALAADPSATVLACSGPEEEVALVWPLPHSPA